jgi:hypothetical protein
MPKFVPVTDSEKPKSEQSFYANELLEHRQFDNPHAVIRSAEEVADEEVDEMAQYLKHAEGANKMVKNEKGLWVKAKTVDNEPQKNEKKGMGRGGGVSVMDKLLQDHKMKQTDRDIPAESSRQFEDPKEEKSEKSKRRSPSSSEERTSRDKKTDNRIRDDSRERRRDNDRRRDSSRDRKTGRKDRSRSRSPHYKRERSRDRDRDRRRSSSRRRDHHRDRNDRDERKGERDRRSRSRDRDRRKHKDDYDSEDDRRDSPRKRSRTPEEKRRRKQKYESDSSDAEKDRKESSSSRKKETPKSYSSDEEKKKVSKKPPQPLTEKKVEKTTTQEMTTEKKIPPPSPEPETPMDIPPMTAIQILNHFHEIFALKSSNRRMDQLMELFHPTCQIKNMKTGTVHLNGKDAIRAAFQKTNPHEVQVSKRIYFEHSSFVSSENNEKKNSSLVTYACDFHREGTSPGLGDISKDTLLFYECADNQILTVWGMNDSEHLSQQVNLAEDTIYFGSKVWSFLEGVLKDKWGKEISEKKINLMEVSHYHNYDQMEVWG